MAQTEQSLDQRGMAREQERRVAAGAELGLNAARPFIQFQASLLRLVAHNFELAARTFEKGFESVDVTLDQHRSQPQQ